MRIANESLCTSCRIRSIRRNYLKKIAELVEKRIEGISDLRDEVTVGMRVVVELKRDAQAQVVLNQL